MIRKKVDEHEEQIVNPETGEIQKRLIRVWDEAEISNDKNYVKVFNVFTEKVVRDKDIAGKAIRLLLYIASRLKYDDDTFYISPTETAKELGVRRETVQGWLKILLVKGIIRKNDRRNWYKVNPQCVYNGIVNKIKLSKG